MTMAQIWLAITAVEATAGLAAIIAVTEVAKGRKLHTLMVSLWTWAILGSGPLNQLFSQLRRLMASQAP